MLEVGSAVRALTGHEHSGDAVFSSLRQGVQLVALVDAVGHGREASEEAQAVVDALAASFERNPRKGPAALLQELHQARRGGRGAVCAVACVESDGGALSYAGVGDVSAYYVDSAIHELNTGNGTLGHRMGSPRPEHRSMSDRSLLLIHSDGVSRPRSNEPLAALRIGSARDAAWRHLHGHAKVQDDASCLVLRYIREDDP